MRNNDVTHTQIRLPNEVVKHIDDYINKYPYFSTRTDFVKHCIRSYIENNNGSRKDGNFLGGEGSTPNNVIKMVREDGEDEVKTL